MISWFYLNSFQLNFKQCVFGKVKITGLLSGVNQRPKHDVHYNGINHGRAPLDPELSSLAQAFTAAGHLD